MKGLAPAPGDRRDGRETASGGRPPFAPSSQLAVHRQWPVAAVCSLRVPCRVTQRSQCQLDSSN